MLKKTSQKSSPKYALTSFPHPCLSHLSSTVKYYIMSAYLRQPRPTSAVFSTALQLLGRTHRNAAFLLKLQALALLRKSSHANQRVTTQPSETPRAKLYTHPYFFSTRLTLYTNEWPLLGSPLPKHRAGLHLRS